MLSFVLFSLAVTFLFIRCVHRYIQAINKQEELCVHNWIQFYFQEIGMKVNYTVNRADINRLFIFVSQCLMNSSITVPSRHLSIELSQAKCIHKVVQCNVILVISTVKVQWNPLKNSRYIIKKQLAKAISNWFTVASFITNQYCNMKLQSTFVLGGCHWTHPDGM